VSASDLISLIVNTAFALIGLATLIDLARHADRARLDIALLFGSLALFIAGGALIRALGFQPAWFSTLTGLVLLAHPYLLLRVVDHFRPLSGRVRWAALAGLALAWLVVLMMPGGSRSPLLLVIIAYFILVEGYAAFEFVRGARQASGGVRWRMTTGLPRHFTMMLWPTAICEMSTSTVASASAAASGFIWSMSGQATSAAPTAAAAPVAI